MKRCEKCNVKMELIPFGKQEIGSMGISYYNEYYECPICKMTRNSYNSAGNDLAQKIDKNIFNKIIKDIGVGK